MTPPPIHLHTRLPLQQQQSPCTCKLNINTVTACTAYTLLVLQRCLPAKQPTALDNATDNPLPSLQVILYRSAVLHQVLVDLSRHLHPPRPDESNSLFLPGIVRAHNHNHKDTFTTIQQQAADARNCCISPTPCSQCSPTCHVDRCWNDEMPKQHCSMPAALLQQQQQQLLLMPMAPACCGHRPPLMQPPVRCHCCCLPCRPHC